MIPGIWSSYFVDLSPEDMVITFARNGWNYIELSDEHGNTLLQRGNPGRTGKEFKKFALEKNVHFPQGHLWLGCDIVTENQKEIIDKLKKWLDLFLTIDISAAVLHPGGNELKSKRISEMRLKVLDALTEYIKGTDMTICLENGGLFSSADILCDLINDSGFSNLGICLDTSHLNVSGGDPMQFILKADFLLKALHLSDNDGSSDQHILPYGRGTVSWEDVFTALNKISYEGFLNFEIPGENRCPLPIRIEKLNYLKSIIAYLTGNLKNKKNDLKRNEL